MSNIIDIISFKGNEYSFADTEAREQVNQLSSKIENQKQLLFVDSKEECKDTTKAYSLPDGSVYNYESSTTFVPYELGNKSEYILNKRINSSMGESDSNGWYITNYIPVDMSFSDTIIMRFKGKPPFYGALDTNDNGNIVERMAFYDKDKKALGTSVIFHKITDDLLNRGSSVVANGSNEEWWIKIGYTYANSYVETKASFYDQIAYVRFGCNYSVVYYDINEQALTSVDEIHDCSITIDGYGTIEEAGINSWEKAEYKFFNAEDEERIVRLETTSENLKSRIKTIEENPTSNGENLIPSYWQSALEEGAEAINIALTTAGYNKSAFMFYSDAHFTSGSQMSPKLLKYLYKHTGMTKTFFGGDVVDNESTDYDGMKYLWDWRNQLKDLPNHHSVVGNHDDGNATNNLFTEQYVYGYLLSAEETPDIIRGNNGLYYYIDNPSEKTRYIFLDTAYKGMNSDQTTFLKEVLIGTKEGWHIVVISHIWYTPDYDQYNIKPVPLAGLTSDASIVTAILDYYNSRTGDYADCKGWVEFCIGGHVHYDYDATTSTGIPIILVETDSSHTRGNYTYTAGTTTEASVNGIVADYDNHKIYIVRIGRGESREISVTNYIVSYTNLLDTIGYEVDQEY